ncbi:MAG: hypothetical protein JRH20_22695 [Deltaproteobacteria bacterium]|nr:hypothetical protein [Deltaproteobacteria bacterium]
MTIDDAYEKFSEIKANLPPDDSCPITDNEACTRMHLIDPVLTKVLGWPLQNIKAEVSAGKGRVDYLMYDHDGVCWFVIEAKKRDVELLSSSPVSPQRTLKLSGPALKACWKIIDEQMSEYLGRHMPCFGAVTTGEQWVAFLGTLRPRNANFSAMDAVAFRSLDDIDKNFQQFYDLFSYEGARQRRLQGLLAPESARGLVHCPSPIRVVSPEQEKPLSYQEHQQFYDDLRHAMDLAFRPIQEDADALEKCFVESRESDAADSRLQRIAAELTHALRSAPLEYPADVEREVVSATKGGADPSLPDVLAGQGYLARIVGEPTAGKSVFLKRFYRGISRKLRSQMAVIWIDCETFSPFSEDPVSRQALEELKNEVCGADGPTWSVLREVYKREWNAYSQLLEIESPDQDVSLRKEFVNARLKGEDQNPQGAFVKWAEFCVRNRKRLPCIIVDNVDHLDVAEKAIAWTIGIHSSCFALSTLSLDDSTLWRLRKLKKDQLTKYSPETFWLHRPKIREVIQNRLRYLGDALKDVGAEGGSPALSRTRLGRSLQWKWTVDAEKLAPSVGAVLVDDQEIASWIAKVCNFNIHDVLDLCKRIVLSPHIKAYDLFSSQITKKPPSRWRVIKAIIAPTNEQYQGDSADPTMNIFGLWTGQGWAPLLPGRLLSFLRGREEEERNRREEFPGFVAVSHAAGLFENYLGVPRHLSIVALKELVGRGLAETFDPSNVALDYPSAKVRITPKGGLHLDWALHEPTYLRMMAEVDPIVDHDVAEKLREARKHFLDNISHFPTAKTAETELIETYISYVLDYLGKVSLATDYPEVAAVKAFEQELLEKWCPGKNSLAT